MARARVSRSRQPKANQEGRFLASRIEDAKRRGATNAEIGRAFGINERTVRKIRSGETTGHRTYDRLVKPSREGAPSAQNLSIIRVDMRLPNGEIRSVNARVPTVMTREGKRVAATPADIFRVPHLNTLLLAEMKRLEQRYGITGADYFRETSIVSFRPITHRKAPLRIAISNA